MENSGGNNRTGSEPDITEDWPQKHTQERHHKNTELRMLRIIISMQDEGCVPEAPNQANQKGGWPKTERPQFVLQQSPPAQFLTKSSDGINCGTGNEALD